MMLSQQSLVVVKNFCGGGDLSIVGQFFAAYCESHSVGFFLLGYDISYYVSVGGLYILGNLVNVYEDTRICALDIFDSLE